MELNITMIVALGLLGAAATYLVILFKRGKTKEIYSIVKALVDEAEIKFGSGTGVLKYQYVVGKLYSVLPGYVKLFISDRLLDIWIETAVNELQEHLEKKIEKEESKQIKNDETKIMLYRKLGILTGLLAAIILI